MSQVGKACIEEVQCDTSVWLKQQCLLAALLTTPLDRRRKVSEQGPLPNSVPPPKVGNRCHHARGESQAPLASVIKVFCLFLRIAECKGTPGWC
jgi:hypothetical protein